jgi:poly(beta-D-mannuronate) lyase
LNSCPTVFVPPPDLDVPNKYAAGRAQDRVSAANAVAFEAARGPLNRARDDLNRLTQSILSDAPRRRAAAGCAMSNLARLAEARSLTGALSGQARDLRMFLIPTFAIAYLAARRDAPDGAREASIEAWLDQMIADGIRREDARARVGNSEQHPHQINNHYYWTGLDALLVGVATRNDQAYRWGRQAIARGLDQVEPDGFLAPEVARETRALSYHAFALQPLAMGALILEANGEPPSRAQLGALARLGDRTMSGLLDPGAFVQAMSSRRDGRRQAAQVEVPKTPPALPLLMMLTGRTPPLSAMDARVRCYPSGSLGPAPGVWARPANLDLLRRPGAQSGGALQPIPGPYKICG